MPGSCAKFVKNLRITWSRYPGVPKYTLNNAHLDVVTEYKYLGVVLNNRLTWDNHVQYVVIKANKMLGYIISVARDLCQNVKLSLYKALVLPILEYGQPVWHLYTSTLVDKLEKVQRRATRIILGQRMMEMDYDNRLKLLNWSSLNSRRKFVINKLCNESIVWFYYVRYSQARHLGEWSAHRDCKVRPPQSSYAKTSLLCSECLCTLLG